MPKDVTASTRRSVAVAVVAASVALAGCRSCSRRECETYSHPAHCEGQVLHFCAEQGSSYGYDFGTRLVRAACGAGNECIDDHAGGASCVHRPATACDEATWPGACDGALPLVCVGPSPFVKDAYVIGGSPCIGDTTCAVTPFGASCVHDGTPCTLPADRTSACEGSTIVACGAGKHGRIETLRTVCDCRESVGDGGAKVATCGAGGAH